MDEELKKFWMVIGDRKQSAVQHRHETLESARIEAERLCRKENMTFFVLEAVQYVTTADVPVTWNRV